MEAVKTKELISVVVPAYNHQSYVAKCLRSLASQTYPRLELLVIDDGSSDGTNAAIGEALKSIGERFERTVHVTRPNKGLPATLNELTELSRSDYIFMLASDDIAKPEAVATLHSFLSKNPRHAVAVGDMDIIDSDGERVYWDRDRRNVPDGPEVVYRTFGEFLRRIHPEIDFDSSSFGAPRTFIRGNYLPNGRLFRKSALTEVGGYRNGTLEDWYINSMLAAAGYQLKYIDAVLASYRWHDTNTMKDRERLASLTAETRRLMEPKWYPRTFRIRAAIRRTPIARLRRQLRSSLRNTRRRVCGW